MNRAAQKMMRNLGDFQEPELLLHGRRVARSVRVSCSNLRRMLHFVTTREARVATHSSSKVGRHLWAFFAGRKIHHSETEPRLWDGGHGVEEGVTLLSKQKEYNNEVVGIWAHLWRLAA
jgi:hypothetical protein